MARRKHVLLKGDFKTNSEEEQLFKQPKAKGNGRRVERGANNETAMRRRKAPPHPPRVPLLECSGENC